MEVQLVSFLWPLLHFPGTLRTTDGSVYCVQVSVRLNTDQLAAVHTSFSPILSEL